MSRRLPDAGPTISLFPFLAVLLCVMGGLLVLLVIFSRTAGDTARAAVSAAVADLEVERENAAWRVEQLRGVRDKTAADLATARLQLAGAEEHARQLADEVDRLMALVKAHGAKPVEPDTDELATLEARVRSARESIEKQRADAVTRPPAYAVLPYVGVHGTHRRPLYIECCIDGVFLQPEGIRLSPADFEGPPGPGNPLASALRAAREQISRTATNPGDPAQQPYPLLLVRPSGVMAYYAAREAIASWGSEFGYQLVDEDWTLAFPPADPVLRDVESRAIDEARRRLAWLAEVRPAKPAAKQPLYRAAPTRGGIVADGGPSVLGDQSRWNWTEEQAAGAAVAGGPRAGAGIAGGRGDGSGRGMGSAGDGSGGDTATGRGRPLLAAGTDGVGGGGDPLLAARGAAGGALGGSGSGAAGLSRVGMGTAADGPGAAGGGPATGGADGAPVGDRYAGSSQFSGPAPDTGGAPAGQAGSAGGAGSTAANAGATGAQGAAAAGMAGAAGGQPLPGMLATGGSAAAASATVGGGGAASLSATRGSNWASFASRERPIPITRPVRIECAADEFRILEDGTRRIEKRVPIPGETAAAVDPLVETLRAKVADWGLAGDRMYWKPQLVLSAAAGGAARRDDLQRLLADSGLETTSDARGDEIRNLPPVGRPGYAAVNP